MKTPFKIILFLILCFMLGLVPSISSGQFWGSRSDEDKQNEIRQNARDRNYVGGADEDELKVLSVLPGTKAKKPEGESEGF